MDHLKFAQYHNMPLYPKMVRKRLELLAEIDIAYSVPFIPQKKRHQIFFPGCTCLHAAVAKNDMNIVHELFKRGADVLKQGEENGFSPIHIAINPALKSYSSIDVIFHDYHEPVNALLSAHVAAQNAKNPKCKDGLSHFHIACIVDHTEAVEFFLNAGEFVDQIVVSTRQLFKGYTPLHLSIRYSSEKTAEILLAHGADIHLKDAEGSSPLHLLIEYLIDKTDLTTIGKRTLCSYYKKDLEKLEYIISLILKTRMTDVNFSDDIGFTAFHAACMSKDKSIVEDFLTKGADIDKAVSNSSKLWPGWTPLHFAACSSIEIFKYLVKNGANVIAKNAQGETPLDFCIMRYAPKILHSIFLETEELNNIVLSDGSTKFSDLLIAMNERDSFEEFLQNLSDVKLSVAIDSPIWPGYSLLHLCVIMNEKMKPSDPFEGALVITTGEGEIPPEDYNCTKEEETIYMERMEMCVKRGCSVSAKNAEGLSPIHLAFRLQKPTALEFLLSNCEEDATDPDGWSHLHIACVADKMDLLGKLLNKGSDVNSTVKRSIIISASLWSGFAPLTCELMIRQRFTALHIAVIMGNEAMVEYLLQQTGVDVYTKDDLDRSPLHLAIEAVLFQPQIAQMLIRAASPALTNSISKNGVSLLHVAAFANDPALVDELLREGARTDQIIERDSAFAGETPLHVAIRMHSADAATRLLRAGADVHAAHLTKKFSSPLQYATKNYDRSILTSIIERLTADEYGVGAIDESGLTLLHLACVVYDYSLIEELLKRGADPNAQIRNDEEYEGKWRGKRPLHLLVYEIRDTGRVTAEVAPLVSLLLRYGADETLKDGDSTPLPLVYGIHPSRLHGRQIQEATAGEALLRNQKPYEVNPVDDRGISHFHYACSVGDLAVMKKLLDAGVDVNEMISPFALLNAGETPLHFALNHGQKEAALFLIENGADVRAGDVRGHTPLHTLLRHSLDLELIDVLLDHGADINAKDLSSRTPLLGSLSLLGTHHHRLTLEVLTFFLHRGCKIDLFENEMHNQGIIGELMNFANPNENQMIFKAIIQACDLQNAIKEGFNAISSLVSCRERGELTLENYLEMIEPLLEIKCNIDWQSDKFGATALDEAASCSNVEAVQALLLLGADINVAKMTTYFWYSLNELERYRMPNVQVTKVLADHIWKMKLADLDVCLSSFSFPRGFEGLFPLDEDAKQRFLHELIEMESTYISESLSVKYFMSDLGAVASYPRMLAAQKQAVDEFFKDRADLRKKFPEYCGLLLVQYRKLLARLELLQPARDALLGLCSIELPHLCIEAVLRYLKNDELKVLSNV